MGEARAARGAGPSAVALAAVVCLLLAPGCMPVKAPVRPGVGAAYSREALAKARALYAAGDYRAAAATAAKVPADDPAWPQAADLVAASFWDLGGKLVAEERYLEAADAYLSVDPSRRDVTSALAVVERRRRERAEEHYLRGVRLSVAQDLPGAIAAWEKSLALQPDHPKAAKDLATARALLEKLDGMK
jgi:tetratricopeptide (TPR) repeat protein